MKTQTVVGYLWAGGLLVLMGSIAMPAHGQKTITLSAEGASMEGPSLSRSAFRNQLANAVTIRYQGREPARVQVYMAVYEDGKTIKEFWSDPFGLAPGTSNLSEELLPRADWFPGEDASWCFCPVEWLQTLRWEPLPGEASQKWADPEDWRRKQVEHAIHGLLESSEPEAADAEDPALVIEDDDASPFHPCTSGSSGFYEKGVGIAVVPVLEPGKTESYKIDVAVFPGDDS